MPHWRSAECHVTHQPLLPCPPPHRWLAGAHPLPVSPSAVGECVGGICIHMSACIQGPAPKKVKQNSLVYIILHKIQYMTSNHHSTSFQFSVYFTEYLQIITGHTCTQHVQSLCN